MFVALGQAKISIFIALLRKVILLIPLALLLPHFMGVTGVYAAEAVSDATAAICCTLLFIWKFPKILGKIKQKKKGLPNNGQPPDKALKIKMNRINIPDSVSS